MTPSAGEDAAADAPGTRGLWIGVALGVILLAVLSIAYVYQSYFGQVDNERTTAEAELRRVAEDVEALIHERVEAWLADLAYPPPNGVESGRPRPGGG